MSQGSNSSGGGGSGNFVATSAPTQGGKVADLSDNPLIMSNIDYSRAGLTEKDVQALNKFYSDHKTRKSEYGMSVDKDGNVIGMEHGSKGSVDPKSPPDTYLMAHNHPRGAGEDGCLGGCFSVGDTNWFTKEGKGKQVQVMTAEAREGRYLLAKTKNFDNDGFRQWSQDMQGKERTKYVSNTNRLFSDYKSNKITYSELVDESAKAFNQYIVSMHNEYLSNQKKYGYIYGLEGRP